MKPDPNYPRMLFHRSKPPVTVSSEGEEKALGPEWTRTIPTPELTPIIVSETETYEPDEDDEPAPEEEPPEEERTPVRPPVHKPVPKPAPPPHVPAKKRTAHKTR